MNIDFYIPDWALWLIGLGIGIPAIAVILGLAWLGWMFVSTMKGGIRW